MRIQVDVGTGTLTYETDLPVKVGHKVRVPLVVDFATWREEVRTGTVTSLQSNYDGACKQVLSFAPEQVKPRLRKKPA